MGLIWRTWIYDWPIQQYHNIAPNLKGQFAQNFKNRSDIEEHVQICWTSKISVSYILSFSPKSCWGYTIILISSYSAYIYLQNHIGVYDLIDTSWGNYRQKLCPAFPAFRCYPWWFIFLKKKKNKKKKSKVVQICYEYRGYSNQRCPFRV